MSPEGAGGPTGGTDGTALDPASLQVLISRLTSVADEMGMVLRRSAFSPNIKERADCSAALFTADGRLLVQAEHIPVHLGAMPASVAAVISALDGEPDPGVDYIVNDPFAGGTHLNDITVISPCHRGERLIGWAANRAHHADVGGSAPGSIPADATEIFQEGLRIPPMELTPEVRALLLANSRTPRERAGDLDAQIGANRVGVARLARLADQPLEEVIAYGRRRMEAALASLPDGNWKFEDRIDSFGPEPDQQTPGWIRLRVTKTGPGIVFDFTGTDPQRRGNVSAVEAVTVSAVAFALRTAVDPTIPASAGSSEPVELVVPSRTIVSAEYPAAVGAGNVEVSQRVADVCLGALDAAWPGRTTAANQGTMNNVLIGGSHPDPWVYYETIGGGQGARPHRDGMSGVHTVMTNTRNTPVEALERAYPVRVRRLALRRGSGGGGRSHGGEGIEREVEILEDATVSLITERRRSRPWGLAGGGSGSPGVNSLIREDGEEIELADKVTLAVRAGEVLRILTPGGGGWGQPT